jgi:acetyl esterase/lipase
MSLSVRHLLALTFFWLGYFPVPTAQGFSSPPEGLQQELLRIKTTETPRGVHYRKQDHRGDEAQHAYEKKSPVLFVHGGAFLLGSPLTRRFDFLARRIALAGHPVFSMHYPKLWEGGIQQQGTHAFHCAAQTLSPVQSLRVVAISAGSWLSLRALQNELSPDDPCAQHGKITHFAAISPMVQPSEAVGPRWIARLYERLWEVPRILHAQLARDFLMIHGKDDWLVPHHTTEAFCGETASSPTCTKLTVPGGHFIVRAGLAGTEESTQALLQFLSSSSN